MILDQQTVAVMGLVALIPVAASIVSMIVNIRTFTRRDPPLDHQLAKFLSSDQHHILCNEQTEKLWARINFDRKEWQDEVRALRLTQQEDIKQILYSMRRLENK